MKPGAVDDIGFSIEKPLKDYFGFLRNFREMTDCYKQHIENRIALKTRNF